MEMDPHNLVEEIVDLTGAAPPAMLAADAPVLTADALEVEQDFYLVGLIGGKEVGKTALVNALAGQTLSESSSHGAGTDRAIAYLHRSQAGAVEKLLEKEASGQYRIVAHEIDELKRQVLIDLPDIDSHYESHVTITRRLLRHMLFPVWVQSVEKYADARPQKLLAEVVQGNAPDNFIFCLNKADQVIEREGQAAAEELRADYAGRVAKILKLERPPCVHLISAVHPDRYDLPALKRLLGRQKEMEAVERSRQSATRQRSATLLRWIERQDLPGALARLDRLRQEAENLLEDRVTRPLLESTLPRLLADPQWRTSLAEGVLEQRLARWPIVNGVQAILGPMIALARPRPAVGLSATEEMEARACVEAALVADPPPTAARLASAFAHLQQTSPLAGDLYKSNKLWEPMAAEAATNDLQRRLTQSLSHQRRQVRQRLDRSWGPIGWLFRWLLTIGVAIWFIFRPLIQPLLHHEYIAVIPSLLSLLRADFLLVTLVFLILYFVLLWLILRRHTQRRIARLLKRWKKSRHPDPALDLAAQTIQWSDALLQPIDQRRQTLRELVEKIEMAGNPPSRR